MPYIDGSEGDESDVYSRKWLEKSSKNHLG